MWLKKPPMNNRIYNPKRALDQAINLAGNPLNTLVLLVLTSLSLSSVPPVPLVVISDIAYSFNYRLGKEAG
jgi:hypothetical protein